MLVEDPTLIRTQNEKRLQRILYILLGMGINIVSPDRSFYVKLLLKFISLFLIVISSISIFGCGFYTYRHITDIVVSIESICIATQQAISIMKLIFMFFSLYQFYEILKSIIDHKIITDTKILQKDIEFARSLQSEAKKTLDECWKVAMIQVNFFIGVCIAIMSFYFFNAVGSAAFHSVVGTANVSYAHVFPTEYPFWKEQHNHFPYYQIIIFIDSTADYLMVISAISSDGLFVVMTFHAVALIRILKKMISFSTSEYVSKNCRLDVLKECIDFHERTFQFCSEVNELYSKVSLMQFGASLLELGIVLFEASVGLENDTTTLIKMIFYMLAAGCELSIYCLDGQILITESQTLPFVWYEIEWYNESKEFKKYVYMMILRTNKPISLWAYGFISLSLPTFLSILKTSASYFLVLRNLAH